MGTQAQTLSGMTIGFIGLGFMGRPMARNLQAYLDNLAIR